MFDIGFSELLVIAVVALIVLGPERLPKAARFAGLWVRKARAQWYSVKSEFEREMAADELRRSLADPARELRDEVARAGRDVRAAAADVDRDVRGAVDGVARDARALSGGSAPVDAPVDARPDSPADVPVDASHDAPHGTPPGTPPDPAQRPLDFDASPPDDASRGGRAP